jgi:hypothetical protein
VGLDHRDDGKRYLRPSHAACHARADAEKPLGINGHDALYEERPYKWSRRWYDDPPPGTEVLLGDGLIEMHVGRGIWETVVASGG